jgi:NADH-quinone oxidoreductase subunit N
VYYYLRVIVAIFSVSASEDGEREVTAPVNVPPEASFSLAALIILLFVLGLYPTPFLALIRTISASLD